MRPTPQEDHFSLPEITAASFSCCKMSYQKLLILNVMC